MRDKQRYTLEEFKRQEEGQDQWPPRAGAIEAQPATPASVDGTTKIVRSHGETSAQPKGHWDRAHRTRTRIKKAKATWARPPARSPNHGGAEIGSKNHTTGKLLT